MDLETLNSININNAAQVKELQQFLKARGYYNGPIDGKWGGGTTEGAVKLRNDLNAERDRQVKISENQRIANDPTNNAIRGATEIGPYIGGATVGAVAGHFGARGLNKQGAKQAAETARIARTPSISGEAGLDQMGRMRTARRLSVGSQFLVPAALLGSAEYIRSRVAPMKDEAGKPYFDPETQKWINLGANADQGAGMGLLAHQLYDLKNRVGSPASAADEAIIQTRAMPSAPPPPSPLPTASSSPSPTLLPEPTAAPAPPASPPPPAASPAEPSAPIPNRERLRNAAAAAKGSPVSSKLKKEAHYNMMKKALTPENLPDVAEALNMPRNSTRAGVLARARELNSIRNKSGLFLPFAAGALAYELADSSRARAEDGSDLGPSTADKLTAAGAAAGTAYGMNRLMNAVPSGVGAVAGEMMGPIAAMTGPDFTPETEEFGRNAAVRDMPFLRHLPFGGYREAYDKSLVPSPNPLRMEASPGNQYFPLSSGMMDRQSAPPSPTAADPEVGRAWSRSPRATAIELTRSSGLDPDDIAHLAGVSAEEVHSVLQGIPQVALQAR